MPWAKCDELSTVLDKLGIKPELKECHDCGAKPGEIHSPNCDVQRCSACGGQRIQCDCKEHDPAFSRWTGFWPGELECIALGLMAVWEGGGPFDPGTPIADLNTFMVGPYPRLFYVKPTVEPPVEKKKKKKKKKK